jgi:hypothetical protein
MRRLLRTNYVFVIVAFVVGGWVLAETAAGSKTEQTAAQVTKSLTRAVDAAVVPQRVGLHNANGNACGLLRSSDLQRVQGEQLKDATPSDRVEGGLHVAQCFFSLPTSSKSVALTLMMRNSGPNGRDPREFWNETFHRDKERREKDSESEENEAAEAIRGIGDEAFWSGNRFGGALYILKGNTLVRLSIGGKDNQETRIRKSKVLAQTVLRHL